jgi:hypothetical protein
MRSAATVRLQEQPETVGGVAEAMEILAILP